MTSFEAARGFKCEHYAQKAPPRQVPKSAIYKGTFFNDRVQAAAESGTRTRAYPIRGDFWCNHQAICAARLLPDEPPWIHSKGGASLDSFVWTCRWAQVMGKRPFQNWIRHHSIRLMISLGEAHERLATFHWTLGYNPHVPGLLMEERELNATQLHPTEAFSIKPNYCTSKSARWRYHRPTKIIDCVALFRGYSGVKRPLHTGDLC